MMNPFLTAAIAAFIPLIVGFIWYHPKVLGTAWMNAAGMTEDKMKGANMPMIFGLTYVFGFFASVALIWIVIHQNHLASILANDPTVREPGSEMYKVLHSWDVYKDNFRTFKHGAFHGVLTGITLALPITAIQAMFERRGFKYIAINVGYWIISFALMGGVICQFAAVVYK